MKSYFVYIATNGSKTLYIGVTNNLERRMYEHRNKLTSSFSSRYNIDRLVYFETTYRIEDAILREKQLKGWNRRKKLDLIESMNPQWNDLCQILRPVLRSTTKGEQAQDDNAGVRGNKAAVGMTNAGPQNDNAATTTRAPK